MIKPYEATSLTAIDGVAHGFFSREGGLSQGIYASLNCGLGSSDDQASVHQNRERVAKQLGSTSQHLVSVYQVHSALAVRTEQPWSRAQAPRADAMVTNKPGLALGVLTADCAPVLFADAQARIVGAAHAGWRGALSGVLEATIVEMEALGGTRKRIHAAIGPAISAKAYEVGDEFQQTFLEAHADYGAYLRSSMAAAGHILICRASFATA